MKFSAIPSLAAVLAVLAVIAAASTNVQAFGFGSRAYRLARPTVVLAPNFNGRKIDSLQKSAFQHSSPRYELIDNDEKFQVAIDVPGVDASNIQVNLEDDGQILTISGQRQSATDKYNFSSKFFQSFTVDPAVDTDQLTANLKNGVLIVAAPKDLKRVESGIKSIPITQFDPNVAVDTKKKEEDLPAKAEGDGVVEVKHEEEESITTEEAATDDTTEDKKTEEES